MPGVTLPPWLVEWAQSVNVWDAGLAVAAIVAGLIAVRAFAKRAWPALRSSARAILSAAQLFDAVKDLPAFIERTDATLAAQNTRIGEIHHEVHFNNGSSVKDAAVRTEKAVVELAGNLARVEEGVAGLYGAIDDLAAVDDELFERLEQTADPSEGGLYTNNERNSG